MLCLDLSLHHQLAIWGCLDVLRDLPAHIGYLKWDHFLHFVEGDQANALLVIVLLSRNLLHLLGLLLLLLHWQELLLSRPSHWSHVGLSCPRARGASHLLRDHVLSPADFWFGLRLFFLGLFFLALHDDIVHVHGSAWVVSCRHIRTLSLLICTIIHYCIIIS